MYYPYLYYLIFIILFSSSTLINIGPEFSSVISGAEDDGDFKIPNSFNKLLFNFNSSNLIDLFDSAGASSVSVGPNHILDHLNLYLIKFLL